MVQAHLICRAVPPKCSKGSLAEHETLAKLPNVEFPFQALSGYLEPSRPVERGGGVGKWVG